LENKTILMADNGNMLANVVKFLDNAFVLIEITITQSGRFLFSNVPPLCYTIYQKKVADKEYRL
jgi:hypothetical protein